MGMFLRKSFRAGPIRLNLSKSGLGISAGVKGLRVGTGPRGSYVTGGRHGLYFRESLNGTKNTSVHERFPGETSLLPQESFVDTGVTYPSNVNRTDAVLAPKPQFPQLHTAPNVLYWWGIPLVMIGMFLFPILLIGSLLVAFAIGLSLHNRVLKEKTSRTRQLITEFREESENGLGNWQALVHTARQTLDKAYYNVYACECMDIGICALISSPDPLIQTDLHKLRESLDLDDEVYRTVKIRVFGQLFDGYMEDHHLDMKEEESLRETARALELSDADIQDELRSIEVMSDIRQDVESGLSPIRVEIKLQKSEECYFATEARTLKKKILRTQTVGGVKYKDVGYVIVAEGRAYVTSKRVLMVADGTSSTKLEKILSVTATPEANILELVIDGRKTPLIFTTTSAISFATKIEQSIQTFVQGT